MKPFYNSVILLLLLAVATTATTARADQPVASASTLPHFIVPIANVQSSVWNERAVRKGLTLRELKRLYFVAEVTDNDDEAATFTDYVEPAEERAVDYVVYSATGAKAFGTRLFASVMGVDAAYLRGKRVLGSEHQVLSVVQHQPQAVSFAEVSEVFSGADGALAEGIRVLPFDIDGDGRVTEAERKAVTSRSAFDAYVADCHEVLLAEK